MPAPFSVIGWYCPRGMCLALAQTKEVVNEITEEGCPLIVLLVAQRAVLSLREITVDPRVVTVSDINCDMFYLQNAGSI